MLCAKFGWNWRSDSWQFFLKFRWSIITFWLLSLLEKGGYIHLKKLECSSPTDALYQVWLKLAQWRKFLKFIFVIFFISSSWKSAGPIFWTVLIQWCFVLILVEIGSVFLNKKNVWKVYVNDNYCDDGDGQQTHFVL